MDVQVYKHLALKLNWPFDEYMEEMLIQHKCASSSHSVSVQRPGVQAERPAFKTPHCITLHT